ncbi:MAG TPA: tRNA dihydrouridine synthase DusB [Bacteroidota bacterium]|nr:tRNA dihydrouridine synthase DusB [Bacteroidota bacterium]
MRIGNIDIDKPVILAPMEDVTDISFRLVCKELGADIMYTEFVNSEGLIRASRKTMRKMMFLEEERPFGIQLYGGAEQSMETAAGMAGELRPDLIDINCGCWVKKIAGRGEGAGLLRDLPKMERIIRTVIGAVRVPVTVKTRLGWDASSIRITEVARMVEQTGAAALTIHCRTRAQGHKGEPEYRWIEPVKSAVGIPIIVNGGIDSAEKARTVFAETGCDGVMIAQAAITNPWIFGEVHHLLRTGRLKPEPDFAERVRVMRRHLTLSVEYKGEQRAVLEFRKHYSGYLRNYHNIGQLRSRLMQFTELAPILEIIDNLEEPAPVSPAADRMQTAGVPIA